MEVQWVYFGFLVKLVSGNVIDWKDQLDVVLFCLFYEPRNLFGPSCVKQGVPNL